MQKFWYHSPVRFYRSLEELEDKTNPQNCQFFGEFTPYPLEIGEFHRFLIPNYNNEVASTDLSLWCGNNQIACEFGIDDGKLFRVTFISNERLCGRLEIRQGESTIFWSNHIRFLESELSDGRKYIRIATKHHYDRHLFKYSGGFDWIVTNLPAYDLGMFSVNAEISNARVGGNSTLRIKEAFLDETVTYQFDSGGDANILSFIQVHATNNEFYIDGTKRTLVEKIDANEFAMNCKMSFVSVKNMGFNVIFDEKEVFKDVIRYVLSDNTKTKIYTYNNNLNAIPTNGR